MYKKLIAPYNIIRKGGFYMRKLFSLLLAVSLIFIFTACGMTDSQTGVGEDIKDGADNLMEDTEDKVDDFTDGANGENSDGTDNNPADMPDGTVDGTMENTEENVTPDTAQ